jgi:mandelate racemase
MRLEKLTYDSIRIRTVEVPLKRPIVAAVGTFPKVPLILVDVTTKEGIVGRGYITPYLVRSARYIVPAISDLFEQRKGKVLSPLSDFRSGHKSLNLIGYEGVALIANAALDMAAWDALAKAVDLPLVVLLGGEIGPVPAYNSNGLWLADPRTLGKEAEELVAEGNFVALKLRLGRQRLADDLEAIREVRRAVGADIKLMVDFNQTLSVGDGLRRCHELDNEGLYWFEEPITYNNIEGCAQLSRELKTPVSIGENFYGPRELYKALVAKAADYVMPDLMRIGGVSGWMSAVPIAAAAGIEVSTHLYPEVSAHLMRVTETAHWLEWQDWADPILQDPFMVTNGHIVTPGRPGSGIAWNEQAVEKYLI